MKYEIHEIDPPLTRADGSKWGEGRSEGRHLSSIIHYMRVAVGDLKADSDFGGNNNWARVGLIFELMVENAMRVYFGNAGRVLVAQQEQELDGILMTPDAWNLSDGSYEEYKARWRSSKKLGRDEETPEAQERVFVRNFWPELVQVKANAYKAGTLRARLIVFFVCGDWRPPRPALIAVEFVFTQEELEENWEMVRNVEQEMTEQGL